MNTDGEQLANTAATGPKWPLLALCAVVAAETVVMLVVTGFLVFEIFAAPSLSLASSIALTVMAALATVLLGALTVGIYLRQRWVRGLTAVWQVLQVAGAVSILRGDMVQGLGWGLALASLAGLLLVFHPAVGSRLR